MGAFTFTLAFAFSLTAGGAAAQNAPSIELEKTHKGGVEITQGAHVNLRAIVGCEEGHALPGRGRNLRKATQVDLRPLDGRRRKGLAGAPRSSNREGAQPGEIKERVGARRGEECHPFAMIPMEGGNAR